MTSSHARKAAAHDLAQLSGVPYQSALQAISVLHEVSGLVDIGDLARFVGEEDRRRLSLPTDEDHFVFLRNLFGLYDPAVTTGVAESLPEEESSMVHVPFLVDGCQLWASLSMSGGFRPGGRWRFTSAELARSLDQVEADWTLTVRATRDGIAEAPPEGVADAWLSPEAASVRPAWTSPGPGFDWVGITFESIGQTIEARPWHGPEGCPGPASCGCQTWPAADPRRRGIVMPAPLFTAYQALADWEREDTFPESREFRDAGKTDGSYWIGVELPTYETLWMKVSPHSADVAAPKF